MLLVLAASPSVRLWLSRGGAILLLPLSHMFCVNRGSGALPTSARVGIPRVLASSGRGVGVRTA